jgi:DNA invertase Pin-like site-specific DNA recombinase
MKNIAKTVALYERLSRDDENLGESYSITNQKALLEGYAKEKDLFPIKHYWDDGISGTRFDRPAFMEVLEGVKDGTIGTVIVKDMSRLGRDYLAVGQIQEMFRQKNVRLIAVNDNYDSFYGEDDFMPFRNIMNELYAKDTSRKIRSTFKAKGKAGKHVASTTPYGYLKDPNDGQHWVIDEEAAKVVRQIFQWTLEGYGPYKISVMLEENKVEIPGAHMARYGQGLHQHKVFADPYHWSSSTVAGILRKKEYLGHTVNFKTRKHFKDKKSHYVDEDEWEIFENTQEPIIDEETFNSVQRIRDNVKRYPDGWGEFQPLTGLVYCADCGGKCYCHRTSNGKRIPTFVCGNYGKMPIGTLCNSRHAIKAEVLTELISGTLKEIKNMVDIDEADFLALLEKTEEEDKKDGQDERRVKLELCQRRNDELETLLCKIYEDNALGRLPDARYESMSRQYTTEQDKLKEEIATLMTGITEPEKTKKDGKKFLGHLKKYESFDELTPYMLNEFVEKIVVHERARKGSCDTTQQVDIYFNFIGQIELPAEEIDPEEQARLDEERRKKNRQSALKERCSKFIR